MMMMMKEMMKKMIRNSKVLCVKKFERQGYVWAYKILLVLVIGLEKLWKPRLYCSGESEHT